MHGNVWQLCADSHRQYTTAKSINPMGPRSSGGGARGGSRFDDAAHCRSSNRTHDALGDADLSVGFRVLVRVGKEPTTALEPLTNSIGLKMVKVPRGEFLMGSPESEPNRRPSEGPQHKVEISKPFFIGVYTVTQGQYEKIMGKNPSGGARGPDQPVDQVNWNDAVEFCRKLSELPAEKKAGHVYRLPTQAEWEYACRAGTTTPFSYGNSLSSTQANFDGNQPYGAAEKGTKLGRAAKVGQYKPNAWGLYDMHGNVWQWCADGPRNYTDQAVVDPQGDAAGKLRVIRGGSWAEPGWACRAARQTVDEMSSVSLDRGFRVVMTIVPKE
jgi:formylglycine-generating enzyme required for sulfatase activity